MNVYVACALTHVPADKKESFTSLLNETKQELKNFGFTVLDFLSAIKKDPQEREVYEFDIACLQKADCVLALGDYPGTGLGYELSYTTELRKIPTFVGVTDPNNISKLLRGVSHTHYKLSVFNTPQELVSEFASFVQEFYSKK